MDTALELLSKEELIHLFSVQQKRLDKQEEVLEKQQGTIATLSKDSSLKDEKISYLQEQLAMYKRMKFGQSRERFEGDPNQLMLPFFAEPALAEKQEEETGKKIEYIRKRRNHKGRAKLPSHLPVEEIEIYPEGDLTDMVCIGKEITEELECEPAKFFIKRYIRYKYAAKDGSTISVADLPERVIDKGIPGAGLLTMILTNKYMDHLPLYRQKQIFARENIQIPSSTIEGWTKQALQKLEPLYEQLLFDMKSEGYLQVDETPIKVLDSDKKGATHQGYYWVVRPEKSLIKLHQYEYSPYRDAHNAVCGSLSRHAS